MPVSEQGRSQTWPAASLVAFMVCAALTGCAGTRSQVRGMLGRNPSAPASKPVSTQQEPKEPVAETAREAEADAAERDRSRPEREPLVAEASPHDSSTQMLIATELRDASAADRATWLRYLNSIPSTEVPRALRDRRRGQALPSDGLPSSSGDALLAGHSDRAGTEADAQRAPIQNANGERWPTDAHVVSPEHSLSDSSSSTDETIRQMTAETTVDPTSANGDRPSRFPRFPDLDTTKLWPQAESGGRLRDRFALPRIITGGAEPEEVTPTPITSVPEPAPSSPVNEARLNELAVRDQPRDLRISPGASLWEDEVRKLIAILEADATPPATGATASEQEQYIQRQVALRMLYLIADDPQQAQRVIPQLPAAEQEFWTNLFLGLATYLDDDSIAAGERRSQAINQLRTAVYHLQSTARLQIRQLQFCQRIDGFGDYERFSQDLFQPGEEVLVYCEVRNFHSEPTEQGLYESRLRSSLQFVRQGEELVVDQSTFEATRDVCRAIRTDYYHAHRLVIPPLTPGKYELRMRIEDEFTGKVATETMSFTVR
ncbi:MAG: hypothetical protein KDA58_00325 [Planctomycetaceae bacterium]|nr:hypothetical protein [Planctomycetaceae bacterium]